MIMKKLFVPISVVILFSSINVSAKDSHSVIKQCDIEALDKINYSKCLDLERTKVDRELETWVNNQLFRLEDKAEATGRQSAFNLFKRSQKQFLKYRDTNCKWQFITKLPSTDAAMSYKICHILTTQDRIKDLARLSK